ncbi:MAG TPA: hypothetical protein VF153_08920 [Candidatus Limnocylindria bacterium]
MRLLLAYIDPGSGSLLLQAILAAIVSVPFFFRRTIGGALSRLRGSKPDATEQPPQPQEGSDPSER